MKIEGSAWERGGRIRPCAAERFAVESFQHDKPRRDQRQFHAVREGARCEGSQHPERAVDPSHRGGGRPEDATLLFVPKAANRRDDERGESLMMEYQKFESDDLFGLKSIGGSYAPSGDEGDLGTGQCTRFYLFNSEEERANFLQARELEDRTRQASAQVASATRFLQSLLTKTGRMKKGAAKKISARLDEMTANGRA